MQGCDFCFRERIKFDGISWLSAVADPAHAIKYKSVCRHHITKQKYQVANWAQYEAELRQRGIIIFWMSEVAVSAWLTSRRMTCWSVGLFPLEIETALICGIISDRPLRHTEGLMTSLFRPLRVDLPVPDQMTLSRRCATLSLYIPACHNEVKASRQWRKLHLAVDADAGEILAEVLIDQNTSDISQLAALLEQIAAPIACFTADGVYDSDQTHGRAVP